MISFFWEKKRLSRIGPLRQFLSKKVCGSGYGIIRKNLMWMEYLVERRMKWIWGTTMFFIPIYVWPCCLLFLWVLNGNAHYIIRTIFRSEENYILVSLTGLGGIWFIWPCNRASSLSLWRKRTLHQSCFLAGGFACGAFWSTVKLSRSHYILSGSGGTKNEPRLKVPSCHG